MQVGKGIEIGRFLSSTTQCKRPSKQNEDF
uniref:Uncharacterized protein n=1 Tax=Arundo donax TaxID=35708 RepID=A0A0A8Z5C4_ARUDO